MAEVQPVLLLDYADAREPCSVCGPQPPPIVHTICHDEERPAFPWRPRIGCGHPLDGQRCEGTLGEKPSWMSWGQYGPCRCLLTEGHGGEHECEHTRFPDGV